MSSNIRIGSARIDENGKTCGGKAGDNNGKEVSTQDFYVHSKGWYIFRAKTTDIANALGDAMQKACDNNNIGYNQNDRLGVIKYGIDTKVATNADCSSLVRACVKYVTTVDVGNFTTATEISALDKSRLFNAKVKFVSLEKTPLAKGDILVTCSKGHTAIVTECDTETTTTDYKLSNSAQIKRFGIDISHWQTGLSIAKAKKEGAEFVILKAGGSDAGRYKDSSFDSFYKECKDNGLPVGAYYFGKDTTINDAVLSATRFIDILSGKQFEYPVFYDVEHKSMLALGKDKLADVVNAFCDTVERAGYYVGIYSSQSFYNANINDARLSRYTHWVAKYSSTAPKLTSGSAIDMWQFGGTPNFIRSNKIAGKVVDQNYCYVDYPTIIADKCLNGLVKASDTQTVVEDKKVPVSAYYPSYSGISYRIDEVFKAINAPYGAIRYRKPVAVANGFTNYKGLAEENLALIELAKKGKLKKA